MLFKIIFICSLIIILNAQTFVVSEGKMYDFAEKNAIEDIQEHISSNREKIEQKLLKINKKQQHKIRNFKPEQKVLIVADRNKTFYPNMSYVLKDDIKDASGRTIYKKGFRFNPGDYIRLQQELIVIDADNKIEVDWAKKNNFFDSPKYMILLSGGNAFNLADKVKRPIYYLTKDIAERFQVQKTPSVIKQIQNQIQVSEICLKNCQ